MSIKDKITWVDNGNPLLCELEELDSSLLEYFVGRNSGARILEELSKKYKPADVILHGDEQRSWEIAGLLHYNTDRIHEALAIFWKLYMHMIAGQERNQRSHKGMPLLWIAECFYKLNYTIHSKRYLMLSLCEDVLSGDGKIQPDNSGVYFRLVWRSGLSDIDINNYTGKFYEISLKYSEEALFPESILQRVDYGWMTEYPSREEASSYWLNSLYVKHLLKNMGDGTGRHLEILAEYIMSCMPGCRTMRRAETNSTDYDIVCAMEGYEIDFRSEFGRYFVCECKDWNKPADFTTMAKFCRVLDSTKSSFGILFSKNGISGAGRTIDAEREQLKVYQDRGMVIVVIDLTDLEYLSNGGNLLQLLRKRYESVRLDLR